MPKFTTRAGVTLSYRDVGTGTPVLFSHGWRSRAMPGKRRSFISVKTAFASLLTIVAGTAARITPGKATRPVAAKWRVTSDGMERRAWRKW